MSEISRLERLHFSFLISNLSFVIHFSFVIFAFAVFVMEMRRYKRSLQSFMMLSYSTEVKRPVSLSKSSQYSVSAHSFKDIVALTRYSLRLTEYWASLKFAPIDVPERNSCLARVNSRFSSHKNLYRLYILMANFRLFSNAMFFIYIKNIYKTIKKQGKKG